MNARRRSHPIPVLIALVAATLLAVGAPAPALARPPANGLAADLDGRPIPLAQVGSLHCHDFDRPRIHCFTSQSALDAAVAADVASSVNYVLIYDGSFFAGSSMYLSSDYSALALIGWNDRISSYKGLGGLFGTFYVDWFYGGSSQGFCCNQQVASLGELNNAFSSVQQT